ncbi:MAG: DUF429 domain-containing protein [Alkalispirochaeta sp.]
MTGVTSAGDERASGSIRATLGEGTVRIIGWDAAVDPRNTALSLVRYDAPGELNHSSREGRRTAVVEAHVAPQNNEELVGTVVGWLGGEVPTLLCVDAPLGWPHRMPVMLADHLAGDGISVTADELFRRITDIDVRRRVGKTPLDVGADRIARTALATLNALDSIRAQGERRIDAVTDIRDPRRDAQTVLLLESYPAGWFASEGVATRGYRPPAAKDQRRDLLSLVEDRLAVSGITLTVRPERSVLLRRADDLDAFVCTLNGIDYLLGRCPAPGAAAREVARREGWIWCKDRI